MGWGIDLNHDMVWRLRLGLSLWYAGVFIALLVALGMVTYGHMAAALVRGADDLNQRAVTDVADSVSVRAGRLIVAPSDFDEEVEEARTLFDVMLVQVADTEGRLLARSDSPPGPDWTVGPERETVRVGSFELRLLRHPVQAGGSRVGTIVVGHDMRDRVEALNSLARDLWLLIPVSALITLVVGAWLAGKALKPIRDAFERQKRFIADASHELRTPITIIQAQAEAAQWGGEGEAHAALETIQRNAARMGDLVADLLLLTRADAAALAIEQRPFFLDELAEEIVTELRPWAASRGLVLRFEPRAEALLVLGDPDRLRQLVLNLVDNALAHTAPPGEVVVWVDRRRAGGGLLGVRDTGVGISPTDLPRVFDRFYRVAPAGRPGAGLGLAIAKAIAEAHKGRLTASSTPGHGSEFLLHLPGGAAPKA